MTLNQWDDNILILELLDEPDFSEDTDSLLIKLRDENEPCSNVIIDLQNVSMLNSSNLGALIEIKKFSFCMTPCYMIKTQVKIL